MFTAPVGTFYLSKSFLSSHTESPVMYAALLAVLVTNIVIGSYVVMAFNEPEPVLEEGECLIPALKLNRGKERED